jgi:hypothetical protein
MVRVPPRREVQLSLGDLTDSLKKEITRRVFVAVEDYLAQEHPGSSLERMESWRIPITDSLSTVRAITRERDGRQGILALRVAINPGMSPYVGAVYPAQQTQQIRQSGDVRER